MWNHLKYIPGKQQLPCMTTASICPLFTWLNFIVKMTSGHYNNMSITCEQSFSTSLEKLYRVISVHSGQALSCAKFFIEENENIMAMAISDWRNYHLWKISGESKGKRSVFVSVSLILVRVYRENETITHVLASLCC